jgi:isochorismate hydrolase
MKRAYFTPETIRSKAGEMLQHLEIDRVREGRALKPERSALLVLDMQRFFLEPDSHAFVPSAAAILPNIRAMVRAYEELNFPMLYSRHLNTPQDAGMMDVWWRDLIEAGDPISEITEALDLSMGTPIEKSQYDAFYGTDLEQILKENAVTQVVICGVMTHLCCETTARSAFVRGFEVFFTIDGTATYNEEFHMASLRCLAHGFATPVLVEDVLGTLRGQDGD